MKQLLLIKLAAVTAAVLAAAAASTAFDSRIVTGTLGTVGVEDMYRSDRVVAGSQVPNASLGWVASVQDSGTRRHFCGGTVISDHWVLTAAHCMLHKSEHPGSVAVVTGGTDTDSGNLQRRVADRIVVANYDSHTKVNDLALIHLAEAITCQGPACQQQQQQRVPLTDVPLTRSAPAPGAHCWVLGWGATGAGGSTTHALMAARVDLVSRDDCQRHLPLYRIHKTMLCAGGGATDACQGDSGGPLVCSRQLNADQQLRPWTASDLQLVGAVSWGVGCASPGVPGVYANVYQMRDWINSVLSSTDHAMTFNSY